MMDGKTERPEAMNRVESACFSFAVPGTAATGPATVTLELSASDGHLTALRLLKLDILPADRAPDCVPSAEHSPPFDRAAAQLAEYFSRQRQTFDLPLAPEGTPFQRRVWDAVSQIPYGQTRSYWWVAVRMGDPRAFRAVGAANGANPLPIIIPCHRVVRHDGTLGGYSGGLDWKRFLLAHEGVEIPRVTDPVV
jgi:methylated-DNA-[protein]-cysteine S-methyltransferase